MPITQYTDGGGVTPSLTRRVYYTGTDTLNEGYALCYNFDAADQSAEGFTTGGDGTTISLADSIVPTAARRIQVERPTFKNAAHFAGVVSEKSDGTAGPGWVEINLPGSICNIFVTVSADHVWANDINSSGMNTGQMVTFTTDNSASAAENYAFKYQGLPGCGSAIILGTVDRSSTSGKVQAELMTGPQSGGVQEIRASSQTSAHIAEMLSATDAVMSIGGSIAFTPFGVTMLNASEIDAALTATSSLGNSPGNTSGAKLAVGAKKAFRSAQTCDTVAPLTVTLSGNIQNQAIISLLGLPAESMSLLIGSTTSDCAVFEWNGVSWVNTAYTNSLNTFSA
jgi:hypothetical protein